MKKYFSIVFMVFLVYGRLQAQCVANAGINQHRCSADSTIQLGGNPTATGGSPPYIYEWTINPIPFFSQSTPFLYASHILNDTSIANPTLIYNDIGDSVAFFLKITDNLGCQSFDTCILTTSLFNMHLTTWQYYINLGDSVYLNQIPNVSGGFGNSSYNWLPVHGLNNTNLPSGFWAKPDSSVAYIATVTDSKGCQKTGGGPTYFVNVGTVGVDKIDDDYFRVYPNPTSDYLFIDFSDTDDSILRLFNCYGQNVQTLKGKNKIDLTRYPVGIYYLQIETYGQLFRFKIVKN